MNPSLALTWKWLKRMGGQYATRDHSYLVELGIAQDSNRGSIWRATNGDRTWFGPDRRTKELAMLDCEIHSITNRLIGKRK